MGLGERMRRRGFGGAEESCGFHWQTVVVGGRKREGVSVFVGRIFSVFEDIFMSFPYASMHKRKVLMSKKKREKKSSLSLSLFFFSFKKITLF